MKNLIGIQVEDTIYIRYTSYRHQQFQLKNLKNNDTIILIEKNFDLPEVTVTAGRKSRKFQSIGACYRSYQTNNDSLIFYTDGTIEYVTKNTNIKYKKRLKEYRSYQDTNYLSDLKKRKVTITFKVARTPPPPKDYLAKNYFKKNNLNTRKNINGEIDIITKNNVKIGTILRESNYIIYRIDDIFANKTRRLGKYETKVLSKEVVLIYRNTEDIRLDLVDNFDNLIYSKIQTKYNFKHEEDKSYTEIEGIEEIFVESVAFLNDVDVDKFSKNFVFPKNSKFNLPFWDKCKCELYEMPPYSGAVLGF